MDVQSPPKRVTRARAAKDPEPKTTKIITAAARAKTAPSTAATASTKSTAAKRKVRDHDDGSDDLGEPAKKATRGRPRKVAQTEPENVSSSKTSATKATTRTTTRGRPAKKTTEDVNEPTAPKATRGRPRKTANADSEPSETTTTASTTLKKTTRTRAATTTTKTSTTERPAGRKVVKFAEPNKENEGPLAAKDSGATGMRARPTRRGAATSTRPTKTAPKKSSAEAQTAKPLSPKKVTQMPHLRGDSSEDELAGGDTPLKKLAKSPVKPPSHLPVVSPKKANAGFAVEDVDDDGDDNTLAINDAILNPPELGTQVLGSPPRRFPTSPFKDAMKSPARKLGAVQLPGSSMKTAQSHGEGAGPASPSKSALLQSAAKRPQSPVKGLLFPCTGAGQVDNGFSKSPSKVSALKSPAKRAMPGILPLARSPTKPLSTVLDESPGMKAIMSSPERSTSRTPSEKLLEHTVDDGELDNEDVFSGPMARLRFPGRLSAVMPREADQDLAADTDVDVSIMEDEAIDSETTADVAAAEDTVQNVETQAEAKPSEEMVEVDHEASNNDDNEEENHSHIDDGTNDPPTAEAKPTTPAKAPTNPIFQLRVKDQHPELSWESEDDLSPTKGVTSSTPAPFARTPSHDSSPSKSRRATMGLSSLADQLGSWAAGSPTKPLKDTLMEDEVMVAAVQVTVDALETDAVGVSPEKSSFFEEQMSARDSPLAKTPLADADVQIDEPILEDIMITDEDVALAQEANDMSHLEANQAENKEAEKSFSDSISEASQEYADENQMPVDPAMLPTVSVTRPPITPVRPAQNMFHTTTKVPLKAADHSTPSPLKKKSFSASRVAPRRPDGPARSATVISYSPTKQSRRQSLAPREDLQSNPTTPAKSDMWSSMGTPARTPRKDINPALLRGAVVFVDVHTSEGADASGLFIDLLNQMGARCVKTWSWNPVDSGEAGGATKCGITHVVYKDGGKRTMEKVRQTNGVVHCVGVTWVLDCERENEWLDESPYYIDTSLVPRGGARRRKSMEPKALANMNGTLVNNNSSSSSSSNKRESTGAPKTPMNRRQSAVWMFTPSDQGEQDAEGEEVDDYEWSKYLVLTPVPKTPAPEAVARYAADIAPSTPGSDDSDESDSVTTREVVMRTCPPKPQYKIDGLDMMVGRSARRESSEFEDLGKGVLGRDKDERVRMRLMAARRKSLQFAPKVGSPLARTWQ